MTNLKLKSSHEMTIEDLAQYVSDLISKESGNILGKGQQSMVINRLRKRMFEVKAQQPDQYYEYLNHHRTEEIAYLVSLLTTHHTFFFREFIHFEFILSQLDSIVERAKAEGRTRLRILSAACSRGQEVYSLAMFFKEHLKNYPGMTFEIIGTDIDPECIDFGKNGVYLYKDVESIPTRYLSGNWQRGKGDIQHFAKVKKDLKGHCRFQILNLMEDNFSKGMGKFDLIFCRNVFIYFEQELVKKIVLEFENMLIQSGILVTGLSESLHSLNLDLMGLSPSVYQFGKVESTKSISVKPELVAEKAKPIRVLAVDDSRSVLKLFQKIYSNNPAFQLVGTAGNGIEAHQFLENNSVDIMTLDIHMPEMDGVTYLERYYSEKHPPVIMISSASRDDQTYVKKAIELGAVDFVQKPGLGNIEESGEEIRNKIKSAYLGRHEKIEMKSEVSGTRDYQFSDVSNLARVFIGNEESLVHVKNILASLNGIQPATYFFLKDCLDKSLSGFRIHPKCRFYLESEDTSFQENVVLIGHYEKTFETFLSSLNSKVVSFSCFSNIPLDHAKLMTGVRNYQILFDEAVIKKSPELRSFANDVFPWTSFAHLGTEYLIRESGD